MKVTKLCSFNVEKQNWRAIQELPFRKLQHVQEKLNKLENCVKVH